MQKPSNQIQTILQIAKQKLPILLEEFGIEDDENSNEIRSCCPIHDGDNPTAFHLYKETGQWYCYTHGCHNKWKNNLLGLVQGVLDQRGEASDVPSALNWLVKLLNIDLSKVNQIVSKTTQEKFVLSTVRPKNQKKKESNNKIKIPIEKVRENFVPSQYFLDQGFSKEIIEKYLIQDCLDVTKPMNNRSVFPVFDLENEFMLGVSGRTLKKQCPFCGQYHDGGIKKCGKASAPKWKHWGFNSSEVLYNWKFAQEQIQQTKSLFLVEGPKDVLKFAQNDIYNVTCIFGLFISSFHIKEFVKAGIQTVILCMDNDDAGNEAKDRISKKLGMYFNIKDISKNLEYGEDFADLEDKDFKSLLKGYCNV